MKANSEQEKILFKCNFFVCFIPLNNYRISVFKIKFMFIVECITCVMKIIKLYQSPRENKWVELAMGLHGLLTQQF